MPGAGEARVRARTARRRCATRHRQSWAASAAKSASRPLRSQTSPSAARARAQRRRAPSGTFHQDSNVGMRPRRQDAIVVGDAAPAQASIPPPRRRQRPARRVENAQHARRMAIACRAQYSTSAARPAQDTANSGSPTSDCTANAATASIAPAPRGRTPRAAQRTDASTRPTASASPAPSSSSLSAIHEWPGTAHQPDHPPHPHRKRRFSVEATAPGDLSCATVRSLCALRPRSSGAPADGGPAQTILKPPEYAVLVATGSSADDSRSPARTS